MDFNFWTVKFWSDIGYSLGSGRYLVRKLVSLADIKNTHIIVELWAWEWPVTQKILSEKSPDTRFIVIENDHESFLRLQEKFGDSCEIYEMSAAHLRTILEDNSVDVVISTLPLGSISQEGVLHILQSAQSVLKVGWKFIQYQYALQNLKDVKKYFTVDCIFLEPRNFWPAFIYKTHKK